ncbi:MAG: efflux RND transporter permease subunit [Pseudomonadales bacterium]
MLPGSGLPALAVRRPLLILVMNLLIVIAGLAALLGVEVRELPDVDRPIVVVRANYPGAAPETIDSEVTRILEGAVARVAGVRDIRSSSEENGGRVRAEFNPGVNLDVAAADVREAVSRITRELPERVEELFVTKADDEAEPIIRIAVVSEALSEDALTRIIDNDIIPEYLSIPGVASIQVFGTRTRQLRVAIDPLRLNRFGLTVTDVDAALRQAPFDVPAGSFRSSDQELIVRAQASATTPELIKAVVVRGNTRIGDVAEAYFAPADAENLLRLDGAPVIGLGIVRQAQSNTIAISTATRAKTAALAARFPDLKILVTGDDADFIRSSVREVLISLLFSVLIVVLTIRWFLGSWRATLIPAVAIPVALVGTIAGIWAMGFSLNLLTLLALVLATGLIVDDAIVVLENIQRQQAAGVGRKAAAAIGARQVFFAVLSTTAALIAVFLPISFLPSTTGRLFQEFGFVLCIAVLISSFVALTLTPAIAAVLNLRRAADIPLPVTQAAETRPVPSKVATRYAKLLAACLVRPWTTIVVCLAVAATALLVYQSLPKELVPKEDRGQLEVFATGPDGVGLRYMEREADEIEAVLQPYVADGTVQSVFTIVGNYDPNRTSITAKLAPWSQRTIGQQELIAKLQPQLANIPGSRASAFGRGSLSVGRGRRSGLEVALTGSDYDTIYAAARALATAVETQSELLSNPDISYQPTQPQLSVRVDRRRAADLDIALEEVAMTLRTMVAGQQLIDLNIDDQAVPILLESETGAIDDPSDLRNLFVRSRAGNLVPLSSLTEIVEEGVSAELDRTAQRRAIEVEMDVAPGVALADAVAAIQRLGRQTLPESVDMLLQGEADTLQETSRELQLTYAFAMVIVLLVLIAQFESLTSPVVVLLTVPFALAAAIYALFLSGVSLNIYSQIGLILLIGLMAKNGILLVEFADALRSEGRSVRDAITEAALIRARPITMTIVSTVLGALPLILASGAGAEARQAIGWVVFGGLGLATLFTLFLAPVLYLGVAQLSAARDARGASLDEELAAAQQLTHDISQRPQ